VPFLQLPGNYFLWRGLNTGRRIHFVISGVFLALLMYIYLSGSFAPFVYLFFFLLQWLVTIVQAHLPRRAAASHQTALLEYRDLRWRCFRALPTDALLLRHCA
jgi:hypothetical protein